MANYAVTDYQTKVGDMPTVLGLMETKIETIDDSKTIRLMGIMPLSGGYCQGYIIYDA